MLNNLKGTLYDFILFTACIGSRNNNIKKILIVKTDEIGDYILWRNFLTEILSAEQFIGYEIHFCGNKIWKDIFFTFDNLDSITTSVWLDKTKFKKNLFYRFKFLRAIYKKDYSIVVNPIFSRDKRNDDSIVIAAKAKTCIGMESNTENLKSNEKGYDIGLYTNLLKITEKPIFEFYRNAQFTSFITGRETLIKDTSINISLLPFLKFDLPENYYVVFPGSRNKLRTWPIENFVSTSNWIHDRYGYTVVLCGAASDSIYTQSFCKMYKHQIIDLTAKTSLPEMLSVLKNSKFLISVDTGSVHLAAAVSCTIFGIFNGSQYKRFAPYPPQISNNFFSIYSDKIEKELQNFKHIKEKFEFVINEPYNDVSVEKVINNIKLNFETN